LGGGINMRRYFEDLAQNNDWIEEKTTDYRMYLNDLTNLDDDDLEDIKIPSLNEYLDNRFLEEKEDDMEI
jgi:hypothetical protein